jgi:hypothetical protein
LHRRHASRLAGNQISRPEPYMKRCVRAFHYRSYGKSRIATTFTTSQNARASRYSSGFSNFRAMWAGKSIWPAQSLKVIHASVCVRKHTLKFR